ncbi:hypothetical protein [Pseudomonas putida]|uniref:hypothetical protein n=1 Tax=Pseudomonas putida TaxID=303 RepID=UPI003D99DBDC
MGALRFGGMKPGILPALPSVGASLLAMVVNDNSGSLTPRVVLESIASRLAPTVIGGVFEKNSDQKMISAL